MPDRCLKCNRIVNAESVSHYRLRVGLLHDECWLQHWQLHRKIVER